MHLAVNSDVMVLERVLDSFLPILKPFERRLCVIPYHRRVIFIQDIIR